MARRSLDLARLVIFMSGTTGATGGKSGNAEKHWSHRDQAHVLSGRKVGISEPPAVLAQPKGRTSRRVHCVSGVIDDYIFGARIEA